MLKLLIISVVVVNGLGEVFTPVKSKLEEVIYMYPNHIKEDAKLDPCHDNSVCSVVNQRFWLPPLVYRFCRCQNGSHCPYDVEMNSVGLDNRSQLKTCTRKESMPPCNPNTVGLSVHETVENGNERKDVRIQCGCKWPAYWKLSYKERNSTVSYSEYTCARLKRCSSEEFCGHIRTDTYSTYYHCSCPIKHICLNKDRSVHNVSELLYHGPVMRAYCILPHFNNSTNS